MIDERLEDGVVPFGAARCEHGHLVTPAGPCPRCPGGKPPTAVYLEVTPRPWTQDEDEMLRELLRSGVPMSQIGRTLNRSRYAVKDRWTKLRSMSRPPGRRPQEVRP